MQSLCLLWRHDIKTRVFITCVGVICSIGNNFNEVNFALKNGLSGVHKITAFDTEDMGGINGCEVKNFNPSGCFAKKDLRRMDRASQLCLVAAREAIHSSDLNMQMIDGSRCGVSLGTLLGGIISAAEYYKKNKKVAFMRADYLIFLSILRGVGYAWNMEFMVPILPYPQPVLHPMWQWDMPMTSYEMGSRMS